MNIPHCNRCGNELSEEELEAPQIDPADDMPICDECYREAYEENCVRCGGYFDTHEADSRPGELIIVTHPGFGSPVGYYEVLRWPFFGGPLIGCGGIYWNALRFYAPLESARLVDTSCACGPLCPTCQSAIRAPVIARRRRMRLRLISHKRATAARRS